jgi:hypothetical protein
MRGTLLYPKVLSIWTMALFGMLSLSGVQSVWCFEIRSEHIDIDAASFGIIECSEAGIFRLHFTLFPSITLEFKILRSASESFIAHLRHDPQHWTLVAMSAFQFPQDS